jgi:hypothetical protein
VTLHDDAYNADRMVTTGNPHKELVFDLMKRGVQVELCGATATVHKWGNADLLPGIKVNTDAMGRMSQLAQEGLWKLPSGTEAGSRARLRAAPVGGIGSCESQSAPRVQIDEKNLNRHPGHHECTCCGGRNKPSPDNHHPKDSGFARRTFRSAIKFKVCDFRCVISAITRSADNKVVLRFQFRN